MAPLSPEALKRGEKLDHALSGAVAAQDQDKVRTLVNKDETRMYRSGNMES